MMIHYRIYIDRQQTRVSPFRVRVRFGSGNDRDDFDVSYHKTESEASSVRKILKRVLDKFMKVENSKGISFRDFLCTLKVE